MDHAMNGFTVMSTYHATFILLSFLLGYDYMYTAMEYYIADTPDGLRCWSEVMRF